MENDKNSALRYIKLFAANEQLLIIGDKLYPIINKYEPDTSGKITAILLESLSIEELITLLFDKQQLKEKINETSILLQRVF